MLPEHAPVGDSAPHNWHSTRGMVGREAELGQLHRYVTKALRGERQVVFVTGEPGIGKTTLTAAFLEQITIQHGLWIAQGQCIEQYGAGEAYMPVLEALGRLGREAGGEEVVATLAQYAPTWLAQLPALVSLPEREALHRVLRGATRERMLREVAEALEVLTARRPLVLVLEDLHWSDGSTIDLLAYVAQRRGTARLLIVGTYRPAEVLAGSHPLRRVVQELQGRGHCEEVRLEVLQARAVSVYLHERFGDNVFPADLSEALYQRTEGNPLFMVNVVEHLLREGAMVQEAGQWRVKPSAAALTTSVPESLQQLIEKQLGRLSGEEQRVLGVASVAGAEFAVAAVAAAFEQGVEAIEGWCEGLAARGQFIRAVGVEEWPDGTISGRYSFLHALYQSVVYARMAEARRIQVHRRIATRKEAAYGQRVREIAAELAIHFEAGRDPWRAVRYLGQAGENAALLHAQREAIVHFTKGLQLLQSLPDTAERARQELASQIALGAPLMATQGLAAPAVEQAYGRARELCQRLGETPQLFPVLIGLNVFYMARGDFLIARQLAEQGLRLAQRVQQDRELLLEAHAYMGNNLLWLGELVATQEHQEQALALYDPQHHRAHAFLYGQDPRVLAGSQLPWVWWVLGYPDQALQLSQETRAFAQEVSHPHSSALALWYAAVLSALRGEWRPLQALTEDLMRVATEQGLPLWLALGTLGYGLALVGQGQHQEGLMQMHQGHAAYRATGAQVGQSWTLCFLAWAYHVTGQPGTGISVLDEAFEAVNRTAERWYEAELYRLKGVLTLQREAGGWSLETGPSAPQTESLQPQVSSEMGREAEGYFRQALEIARQQQARSLELRAAVSLSRLWQHEGKRDEARQLLEDIYGWFREGFETHDLQEAEALLREVGSTIERKTSQGIFQRPLLVQETAPPVSPSRPTAMVPSREEEPGGKAECLEPTGNAQEASDPMVRISGGTSTPPPGTAASAAQMNQRAASERIFRQEGEYWTLVFQGSVRRIKDTLGLHYLAYLLQHSHHDFHVLALVAASVSVPEGAANEPRADAGEVRDPQARAAYRRRLAELQAELEEAQAFNDLGRVERVREHIDALTQELFSVTGLGGRTKGSSPTERARVNVTRAIKTAIRKITESHPALGQHLTYTVKTGVICSYTPDPSLPSSWQV